MNKNFKRYKGFCVMYDAEAFVDIIKYKIY